MMSGPRVAFADATALTSPEAVDTLYVAASTVAAFMLAANAMKAASADTPALVAGFIIDLILLSWVPGWISDRRRVGRRSTPAIRLSRGAHLGLARLGPGEATHPSND